MSISLVGRDRPRQTERSSSNGDGIEPESSVSKKQVERLDGVYWSHGISITDTSLVYQRDFLGKESFPILIASAPGWSAGRMD